MQAGARLYLVPPFSKPHRQKAKQFAFFAIWVAFCSTAKIPSALSTARGVGA